MQESRSETRPLKVLLSVGFQDCRLAYALEGQGGRCGHSMTSQRKCLRSQRVSSAEQSLSVQGSHQGGGGAAEQRR
jgi:hypothetical protein